MVKHNKSQSNGVASKATASKKSKIIAKPAKNGKALNGHGSPVRTVRASTKTQPKYTAKELAQLTKYCIKRRSD